jgi:signal transduction histidine kinase
MLPQFPDTLASGAKRASEVMESQKQNLLSTLAPFQRYALAVLSVSLALTGAIVFEQWNFRDVGVPLILFALAVSAWYGGVGPAILAWVLSFFCFDYFFVQPIHSLYVSLSDLPYFVIFSAFASLVAWFSSVRRRVERNLAQRTSELEVVNKELEAFAYSVSHDLRAPLRHMSGFAELLQKTSAAQLSEKGQRYLKMILESANRMGTLIDDLLSFSRIGRAEANKTVFNVNQLLQEVLTDFRQDIAGREIAWKVGNFPSCYGDRSMIRLALVNMISNAVKFTRTRSQAEIEIGSLDRHDQLVILVRDNGVGFDMKYLNKLFGVFQRLHSGETFEGTGIGLATVQRIAVRHGGKVWAEGVVDQGATFYFSFSKSKESKL